MFQVQILQMVKQLLPAEMHQMELEQEVHLEMAATDQVLAMEVVVAGLQAMVQTLDTGIALAEVHLRMVARVEIPLLVILLLAVLAAAEEHMGVQVAEEAAEDIQVEEEVRKTQEFRLQVAADLS